MVLLTYYFSIQQLREEENMILEYDMTGEIIALAMLGSAFCSFIFLSAMAGKMNELAKTFRAQLRHDLHKIELEKLKAKQGGVELIED